MPLANGTVFAGYTIERPLGAGGMGEVYLVRHPRLPRWEALKILSPKISSTPEFRQRFEREADIAAALWHPHIVAVHDRGDEDGQLWITMDYVEGTDAARLVRRSHPRGMPVAEALSIVSAIAEALDYAHERALLHRDVKPANILITGGHGDGRRIMLADFGIARAFDDAVGLTSTNTAIGSVDYAAPEQLTGHELDGRADQYALACTAYYLLTGSAPHHDPNPAVVIGQHLSGAPTALAGVHPGLAGLDPVLAKALATDPAGRYPTCGAFADALAAAAGTTVAATTPAWAAAAAPTAVAPKPPVTGPPPQETVAAAAPRHRSALPAAGVAALLLAVGAVAFLGTRLAQPGPSTEPAAAITPVASSPSWPETVAGPPVQTAPPVTVTQTAPPVTITATPVQPTVPVSAFPAPTRQPIPLPGGDLGLAQPISRPRCNGQGIVILGSVTTPGLYPAGVQRLLDAHPGAFYLRTDSTCPSLRQATAEGDPIYAVFLPGGVTTGQVCAAVRAAGPGAYGKWLDYTTDPGYIIPC